MSRAGSTERTFQPSDNRTLLGRLREQVRRLEGEAARSLAGPLGVTSRVPRDAEVSGQPMGMCPRPRPGASASFQSASTEPASASGAPCGWDLGEPACDRLFPRGCLDPAGLIELKPAGHGDWPATLAFAACLAVRRLVGAGGAGRGRAGPVLWCTTAPFVAEHGRLHGHGLGALGLAPEALITVDAPREADALWVLEQGLRSRALSLVVGMLREVPLTPSRRLGLAAAAGETPALLLTLPASAPAPSARARLRIGRLPSAPHPIDPRAFGAPRFRLALERCRQAPSAVETGSFDLEWCDVTYRFHLAPGVADRALAAPDARSRARG